MNDVDKASENVVGMENRETAVYKMFMKEEADLVKRKKKKGTKSRKVVVNTRRNKMLKGQQSISNFLWPKTARGGKLESQRDKDKESSSEDGQSLD